MEPNNPLLDDYVLKLTRKADPRVCFVPTASGDATAYTVNFYSSFTRKKCRPSHLAILQGRPVEMEQFVLGQDVIYVGGGNTATMMASWRVLGLDEILRKAWLQGVILTGLSAGSICWFESGPSDSWGAELRPVSGLGFLPGSHCPHYDGEADRRPSYQRLIQDGLLPDGYAADDGAALVFRGTSLDEVVSSRPQAQAWRVERNSDGGVTESALPTRFLSANT